MSSPMADSRQAALAQPPASRPPATPAAVRETETRTTHAPVPSGRQLAALSLAALGVVFGDIGTSPLYAVHVCFSGEHGVSPTPENVLGGISLIFWALIIIVSVKYIALVMRADNRGEGGILALLAMVGTRGPIAGPKRSLILLGLFGAALLYGDGMITPSISVLSAVEGIDVATSALHPYIVPITVVVLAALFAVQRAGTDRVGTAFGPVMLLWFLTLAVLGVREIAHAPQILRALSPVHAITFFHRNGAAGYVVLGGVFLAVTGGEALYADMGHFGRRPIRIMWFAVTLPALVLNYLGQGAWLLGHPGEVDNIFYRLAPSWSLYPLVGLATIATVIASQALISASFSLTQQAVQLGYSPRVEIVHTSSTEIGQIYVPGVNTVLMLACLGLVFGFKSSSALASAYGLAVTGTMAITTVLYFDIARSRWRWSLPKALIVAGPLLAVDLSFLGANALKIVDGGWFPLAVGIGIFTLMTTWKKGRDLLFVSVQSWTLPIDVFLADIKQAPPTRVPGLAVFMTGSADGVPHAMLHNLKHNKVLHERNLLLTVITEEVPHVRSSERMQFLDLGAGFWRLTAHYGFMETPNVLELLEAAGKAGFKYRLQETTFFLGRETIVATKRRGMALWREKVFAFMSRNARSATTFFGLPVNRVVEMGSQVEI
jgi:KUP system potassium uptake protein